ncbi:MAG TPA: hypothetical protein VIU11_04395 [Nakamurella sp.]
MAGETWKSHQMTTRERDMDMDHAQQLGDVDAAAAIHDDWMFGPEADQDTGDLEDWNPANYRVCTLVYPNGIMLITRLHVDEIARQMFAHSMGEAWAAEVTVEPPPAA